MFELTYKSDGGKIVFGGGSNEHFNITKMTGFDFPVPDYTTITYASENGITTTGKRDKERTLTISGDLYGDAWHRKQAVKALYFPGVLSCIMGEERRKIECKCTAFDGFDIISKSGYSKFTIQFVADYPYFTSYNPIAIPIFKRENVIDDTFTLPCVFTKRVNTADIINDGDKFVYPSIVITFREALTGDFVITNESIDATIHISDYTPATGEVITIDLAARKIVSSVNGSITNYISNDTVLSDFFLQVGNNHLTFENHTSADITAIANFSPEYFGAIR